MNNINWDDFKCRCSSISKILSNSKSNPCLTDKQAILLEDLEKKPTLTENQKLEMVRLQGLRENSSKIVLSDTCIQYLMEHYSLVTTGKRPVSKEMMYIQYVEKGKEVEEQSITLISLLDREFYQKNEERVYNDFLSGEPDIFIGDNIMNASKITDTKSVWDYPTFLQKVVANCIEPNYDLQIKGYMDITGATEGEIAYTLVNTPDRIINDFKRNLLHKMDVVTEESPEYKRAVEELERSMYFDDIPRHQRVFKVKIEPFSQDQKQKVYDRVKICREWLSEFDKRYQQLNQQMVTILNEVAV